MKILILSNAPWANTGYGRITRELIPFLQGDGHQVAVLANYGLSGAAIHWHDVVIYPQRHSSMCEDMLPSVIEHFGADVVLTQYDVWAFEQDIRKTITKPWISLTPIDGSPVPLATLSRLRGCEWVTTYSRFGQAELEKSGFHTYYTPPGIDTGIFKPGDKAAAREALGIDPNRFMITTVGANKGWPARKGWPESLMAFKVFNDRHPDALYYCHTTKVPYGSSGGIWFDDIRRQMGIPENSLAFPDQSALAIGVPDSQLALIYQASDVFLLLSMGEGFGLPLVEAQACGCPVVTTKWSSCEELTRNGALLPPEHPLWVPQLQYYWRFADPKDAIDALETIYGFDESECAEHGAAGVEFVQNEYAWPVVYEKYWRPLLETVEAQLW
jgi:glycosyltransferase involved in cell wall biosynthesis